MALNIKDPVVERLAEKAAKLAGDSKTGAIRAALAERVERLTLRIAAGDRRARLMRFLEEEAWPAVPAEVLGRRVSKKERERILGYGAEGV